VTNFGNSHIQTNDPDNRPIPSSLCNEGENTVFVMFKSVFPPFGRKKITATENSRSPSPKGEFYKHVLPFVPKIGLRGRVLANEPKKGQTVQCL